MAFLTLALSQVIQAFNMRSERSIFKTGLFGNKKLNLSVLVSLSLIAVVLFTPLSIPFGMIHLTLRQYLYGIALALVPVVVMEIMKLIEAIIKKNK